VSIALWHAPGAPPPQRLVGAVQAWGASPVAVTSAYAALAEVCRAAGGVASETSRPTAGPLRDGVIVVYPERLEDVPALCEALGRYAPAAGCWAYGPASNPRLLPIVEPKPAGDAAAEAAHPVPPPAAAVADYSSVAAATVEPKLRLTETGPVNPPAFPADGDVAEGLEIDAGAAGDGGIGGGGRSRGQLLTAEELAMLLGDDQTGD
jgi:hypothetical protein